MDNRVWRIRLDDDAGGFWFRYSAGNNVSNVTWTRGWWRRDLERFTSFTTKQALNTPWNAEKVPFPGGGNSWHFECVGRIIPLKEDI